MPGERYAVQRSDRHGLGLMVDGVKILVMACVLASTASADAHPPGAYVVEKSSPLRCRPRAASSVHAGLLTPARHDEMQVQTRAETLGATRWRRTGVRNCAPCGLPRLGMPLGAQRIPRCAMCREFWR